MGTQEITVQRTTESQPKFESKDDELLATLGYKAELKRNFSVIEVFGVAFSIMSLVPSIASTIGMSMVAGPVGMTWGWLLPSICILAVGASMAEMGSAMPTSGGLYWWTFKFFPKSVRKPLSFLAGYSNTLGLIGGLCSIDCGFASIILSCANIGSNGTFVPNKFHTYGVFVGCVISHGVAGSLATKYISKLQTFCIVANMAIIVITCIGLPLYKGTENLNSGTFVFGELDNLTDWPKGWTFISAWLSAIWTIGAFDSCVHMAEEATNATIAVPFGILGSISMCGFLGFVILTIVAATMNTDIAATLSTTTGQPLAQVYYDVMGKNWALGIMAVLGILQWFMGLSVLIAGSRQVWAFSRDDALPFSNLLKVVNYKLGVPIRAVWFMVIISVIIGLLTIIDSAATLALFSLAAASNSLAWLLPIFARSFFNVDTFKPGPFYMGDITSRAVGIFASLYLMFVIFVLTMMPSEGPNPTPQNMNYTCVINGFVWFGCMLYYFLFARKWFEGPKQTLDEFETIEGSDPNGSKIVEYLPEKE
ncbi:hypothetical protein D0Z00_004077 [Geotrichum galactomycetum]|uniref:Uncharacterized protein n=1 Tax=Geotrichum galactomycetum TaxID=27317 RepID=A0ACB6UZI8_9ASCO|nr:hypothetical protein D0Z00_004077 [Geotrichum candidum]